MSSQAILSVVGSIITGIFSGLFVSYKSNIFSALPDSIISILILILVPLFCYLISIIMSSIRQFEKCGTVDIQAISVSNSAVLGTTGILSGLLYFESIPFLKYIFGAYAPRNPITGEYIMEGTPAYTEAMSNEKHYKIQFFSNIVKSVLPIYLSESVKDGFAYTYWIFWMTMLPLYFLLSMQGVCA
jgi:hypothetical protein